MNTNDMERNQARLLERVRSRDYPDALIPGERVILPERLARADYPRGASYVTGVRMLGDYGRLVRFIADTLASIPGGTGGHNGYNAPLVLYRLRGTALVPERGYLPAEWTADTGVWTLTDCAYWSAVRTRAYLDAINQAMERYPDAGVIDALRAERAARAGGHIPGGRVHAFIQERLDINALDYGPVDMPAIADALTGGADAIPPLLAALARVTDVVRENARPDIDQVDADQALETAADYGTR